MMELNGREVTADELKALGLTNYGHFTSMAVTGMRVRGLDLHLARLARDCRVLFGAELDLDRVRQLARRVASTLDTSAVVRITVFDPHLDLGRPSAAGQPQTLVTVRAGSSGVPAPLRLTTARYERDLPQVKHVGLFANLLYRRQAQLDGFDDVLFVDSQSRISEGATWNIAFVQDGTVHWPEADCLPGVTMHLVKEILQKLDIPSMTTPIDVRRLLDTESAFVTNAAVGIRAVKSIGDRTLAEDAALIGMLRTEYLALPGEKL